MEAAVGAVVVVGGGVTAGWSLFRYGAAREGLLATGCQVAAWLSVLAAPPVLLLGYYRTMTGDDRGRRPRGTRRPGCEGLRVPESDEVRVHALKASEDDKGPHIG